MNGIIHPARTPRTAPRRPPSANVRKRRRVRRPLFAAVRPQKLLYLAIDGVAPRAKMNQQRARRFRTAQEAAEKNAVVAELKEAMGLTVLDDDEDDQGSEWDSNVITPGTPFMHKLSDFLRWYVAERVNKGGEAWRRCVVILSDASEPGEGEHKIMEYIRQQRTQPGSTPIRGTSSTASTRT